MPTKSFIFALDQMLRYVCQYPQKLNIKDPAFLKLLEQEYASKYLQNLRVEPSQKNINKVLKENPLSNCDIVESRMNGGLHTDTITISTRSSEEKNSDKNQPQSVSGEMLQMLNLKRMQIRAETVKLKTIQEGQIVCEGETQKQDDRLLEILHFGVNEIKQRYIFPFNENFKRKNNYKMRDHSNLLESGKQDSKIIFEAKIFSFPFTQVKLSIKTLKELQTPINTRLTDIMQFLEKFCQQFPRAMFPICPNRKAPPKKTFNALFQQKNETSQQQKRQKPKQFMTFQAKDIERVFELLRSQEFGKMIGVLLHLSYWSIFGGVNPIQVENSMKKKMYIMMFETLEYFDIKIDHKKLWTTLVMPMLLLSLKMAVHYFFAMQYPKLFQSEQSIKVGANEIGHDKIIYFIEKMFDQSNISGRFIFLESDIDGEKGNFIKDKKFIRKRIFGTSPALSLILPQPKDGKARSIMAKNLQIDQQDGIIQDRFYGNEEKIDNESREKLLNLAMHKINSRIEDLMGSHGNSILNLES